MPENRRLHVLAELSSGGIGQGSARLCEVAADLTAMTGASIMLMSDGAPSAVCSTNDVSALIEELQYTVGEGPCLDAFHRNEPVLETDLAEPATARWFAFTGPALEAGVRSIFGFPLRVGGVRVGALDLYRDRPGPLTGDQHAYALVVADVAAQSLLSMQAAAPAGELSAELAGADSRWAVHQAAGMVSVQLGVTVVEALVRLRAYAFANNRALSAVSEAVVNRQLRFNERDEKSAS